MKIQDFNNNFPVKVKTKPKKARNCGLGSKDRGETVETVAQTFHATTPHVPSTSIAPSRDSSVFLSLDLYFLLSD